MAAPQSPPLDAPLADLIARWPERFRRRFGTAPVLVAPRVVIARSSGRALRATRAELGRAVGALKQDTPPGSTGIVRRIPVSAH